jgi:hypothetical protein
VLTKAFSKRNKSLSFPFPRARSSQKSIVSYENNEIVVCLNTRDKFFRQVVCYFFKYLSYESAKIFERNLTLRRKRTILHTMSFYTLIFI